MLHGSTGIAHGADGLQFGKDLAVFAPVPDFAVPVAMLQQVRPHGGKVAGIVATGGQNARILSNDIFTRVSGNPGEGRVDVDDGAVRCRDHDALAGMPENTGRELQRGIPLSQCSQQVIKTTNQLANFVLACNGQGLRSLIGCGEQCQGFHGVQHGRELAAQHPPGQRCGQQGEKNSRPEHALAHLVDGCKSLGHR